MRILLPIALFAGCSSEVDLIAQDADPLLSEAPVPENPIQSDRVVQVVEPVVDILFIVDNSSSMGNEQQQLRTNFPIFLDSFVNSGMDYHIGVVSTDMQRQQHRGKLRTGLGERYIDVDTEDPDGVFSAMTNGLGVIVGSVESGRAAAYTALEIRVDDPENEGFLRDEADLHMIFVSDDNDYSGANPVTKGEFIQWATSLKGGLAEVQMHGIVTPPSGQNQGCGGGNNTGTDYIDYAAATNGITFSVCVQDWSPALDALGLLTAGLKREFFLTRVPVIEPELLLEVQVRLIDPVSGQEITRIFETCLAGTEIDNPSCEVVYNPGRNSIAFLDYVPDALSEVLVTYPIAENYSAGADL